MTIHTISKTAATHESWQIRASTEIMTVIMNKGRITYAELATAAGITGPHKIHRLTLWLEEMMAEDYRNGRPLRAAVVISKARGGLPASGFFDKAEQLGLNMGGADRVRRYEACLQSVYASYNG